MKNSGETDDLDNIDKDDDNEEIQIEIQDTNTNKIEDAKNDTINTS